VNKKRTEAFQSQARNFVRSGSFSHQDERRLKTAWTPEVDHVLRECAAKGFSPMQIALRMRRTVTSIKHRAWVLQIPLKEPSRLPGRERLGPLLR
jgi:hypothetical protein